MVAWWPAGSTGKWVRWAKERGLAPPDAACLAMAMTTMEKVRRSDFSLEDAERYGVEDLVSMGKMLGDSEG